MAVTASTDKVNLGAAANRTRMAIVGVVSVFIALYWFNLIQELAKNDREAMEAVRRHAVFSAHSAAEAVETTLDRLRLSLRIAATAAQQGPEALALYGQAVSSAADDVVMHLLYADRTGHVIYSSFDQPSGLYVGDRQYFQALAKDPSASFTVGPPVSGRLTKRWSIHAAHAVRSGATFQGVVAIAVSAERWAERLAKFEAGPNDVLALFSAEGIYMLRTRDAQTSFGQQLPRDRPFLGPHSEETGTYVEPGARDGILRLYAWKRLASGHVVISGVALEDALAQAREISRQTLLRGGAATAALILAMAVITHFSRRSERALRAIAEQEYLQRVTLSVMAEGLAVVRPSGEVAFHNDSFARILPYDGASLLRLGSAWEVVDTEGTPVPLDRYPSVVTARTGQPFDHVTLGVRTPDGAVRWLNVNTRPLLGRDGLPYAAILTIADISSQREAERALKESEERYRTVVDSLVEGIVVLDASGRVIASNPAAERILGLGPDGVAGMPWNGMPWPAITSDGGEFDSSSHPALLTLSAGTRKEGVVMGLAKPDGAVTWVEVNTAPLWGGDGGRPAGAVASILDITKRKAFEDELSRSNAELEQFAYAVSHDLREPLRMVASYVQLIKRRLGAALSSDIEEFVGYAVDGATRMDRMLVALLEYSRVGRMGQPKEWIDSRKALDEALLFLSPAVEQTGAEVTVLGEWPEIFASPDEIERLFQNLVGNALKYHRAGVPPRVELTAREDGAVWRFSFSDNGIGIPPDQTGRLFKVFQRLHAHDGVEGSGVGLALCRKIVQRHDGRIWVEPAETGSTFVFTLPVAQARPRQIAEEGAEA